MMRKLLFLAIGMLKKLSDFPKDRLISKKALNCMWFSRKPIKIRPRVKNIHVEFVINII